MLSASQCWEDENWSPIPARNTYKMNFIINAIKIDLKDSKYIRMNFTQDVQNLYTENYKTSKVMNRTPINGEKDNVHGLRDSML